jgi:PEGA domain-containing protein
VVGVPFRRFYQPYYAFRPRFTLGLGLFVGYPIAFPYFGYAYPYPYAYSYPYSYPYPDPYPASSYPYPAGSYPYPNPSSYPSAGPTYPGQYPSQYSNQYPSQPPSQGSVGVAPGQTALGGVSFDITPGDAQVYVDGSYMGVVSNFSATSEPLTLTVGRHSIEIRAAGYKTRAFEADVTPGQVIPYQGTMER